jgi:hypothetical protein
MRRATPSSFTVTGYPSFVSYAHTTVTSRPWAAATPSATRRTPSTTDARRSSESARIVPSRNADSGITLFVVPASMCATVTTAGSKTFTDRVTIVWRARAISHAAGMGSRARCGAEACPPRPEA